MNPVASPPDVSTSTGPDRKGSLKPVLDVIPASCYERSTARGLGLVARDLALYGLLVTGLALTNTWWLLVPLWVVAGMVVAGLFVIGHDAAHQALFDHKRLNDVVARVAMIPSVHVTEAWVLGHNRVHHQHTVKRGLDFVWHPTTPDEWAQMGRGARLLHRIEWSPFGSGVYYLRQVWWNKMMSFDPPARWKAAIRRERHSLLALHGLIFAAVVGGTAVIGAGVVAGLWMWTKVVLVPFLLFNWWIGWTVHVHHIGPDELWWERRDWTKFKAQVEGTTILHAPKAMDIVFHWIFEHAPHHVDPRIPCYHLKEAGQAMVEHFPEHVREGNLSFRNFWHDARACKLYDFDAGRWLTYREAAA